MSKLDRQVREDIGFAQKVGQPTKATKERTMSCFEFFGLLGITLTLAQGILIKVAIDGKDLYELSDEEAEIGETLFGFPRSTRIDPMCRRIILLLLGRGSGKSLMCAGIAIYLSLTLSLDGAGPGSIPVFMIVAPTKVSAVDITLQNVRALIEENPRMRPYMVDYGENMVLLRRPDGKHVRILAAAADKGGRNLRGLDIAGFILEEAQFFNSDPGGRYIINDRDVYNAMTPRFLPGAVGLFISTPWPSENLMSEMFEKNFSHPVTSLCAKAPTAVMRPDRPELARMIEEMRERDPDNARREFDCDTTATMTGSFFDQSAIERCVSQEVMVLDPSIYHTACCIDLAFRSDSSVICIVQYDGHKFNMVHLDEIVPKEGVPLKPSEVLALFADTARTFGCRYVLTDGHYREAAREAFQAAGISVLPVPEGASGKLDMFLRAKSMLDEGRVTIVDNKRFRHQARMVRAVPTSGGSLTIKIPRRTGMGHGDLISAWVPAVHHLSYAAVVIKEKRPKPGDPGYQEYFLGRMKARFESDEAEYIKKTEKSLSRKSRWRFS